MYCSCGKLIDKIAVCYGSIKIEEKLDQMPSKLKRLLLMACLACQSGYPQTSSFFNDSIQVSWTTNCELSCCHIQVTGFQLDEEKIAKLPLSLHAHEIFLTQVSTKWLH